MRGNSFKGALVGCGFFATNHMHGWAGIKDLEIRAVCDLDLAKAEAMARKFGVEKFYSNVSDMLDGGVYDFIDVATTPSSHREIVELVCGHTSLVICQKPFAESMEDAAAMVMAADKAGTPLVIHENFRWQKAFISMKRLVDRGAVGTPHFARFSFRHGYDNYKNQPYLAKHEKLAIMDVGLHLFDLARHFLGNVERLSCTTQSINPAVRGEDVFTALLTHQGGATTICECSFATRLEPEPFPQTMAWIEGDRGTLVLDGGYRLSVHETGKCEVMDVEPAVPEWGSVPWHNVQDSVVNFQNHTKEILYGNADPQPSGADNLETLALGLAAYDAAATGTTAHIAQWKAARP